jgi:hypothetical protein
LLRLVISLELGVEPKSPWQLLEFSADVTQAIERNATLHSTGGTRRRGARPLFTKVFTRLETVQLSLQRRVMLLDQCFGFSWLYDFALRGFVPRFLCTVG